MDAADRIRALADDGVFDGPWAGSFVSLRSGLTAAGYNESESEGVTPVTTPVILAAGPSVTGDSGYTTDMAMMNGTPWEGVLVVEGVPTGDGRQFSPNAVTWAEPPLALRWNMEDSHGGQPTTKAVLVGRIDEVYRNPDDPMQIMGRGVFDDDGANGAEALRLVQGQFLKGISVDPDDISDADVELIFPEVDPGASEDEQLMQMFASPEMTIFHAGRLRAATLVDIPAFVEAQVWLSNPTQIGAPPEVIAAAAHFDGLSDRQWNGPANEKRLAPKMTVRVARTAFAHVHNDGDTVSKTSARFLHHEVDEDGEVGHANLTACSAGIRTINAGRAETLTGAERLAAYTHLVEHLRSAGLVAPPYAGGEVIVASSFDHLVKPPTEWFTDPGLSELTPLTVTDDGRVFGHGAAWGSCHTGVADFCQTPPAEPGGEHAYYRLGEVVTADGSRIAVGHITLGTGHAATRNITSSQAAEHYDNTGSVVAVVASGEDDHGIWVAGAVRPGVSEARVQELRAASLSGDWRRIGGALRLVAFLAVNRPGFPVPRTAGFVSQKKQLSLVAAGVVSQDMRVLGRSVGADAALARIAKSIGRDPVSRMKELSKRLGREN